MASNLIDAAILQMFGVRIGDDGSEFIHAMEGRGHATGKLLVKSVSSQTHGVPLTPIEARYFAGKLVELADRVERKAKAKGPCAECGHAS